MNLSSRTGETRSNEPGGIMRWLHPARFFVALLVLRSLLTLLWARPSFARFEETHLAIAKAAG